MAKYDQQAAIDAYLDGFAAGRTLRSIHRDNPDLPTPTAVRLWAIKDDPPGFASQYMRAREMHADALMDEAMEIADDATRDTTTKIGKNGQEITVCDHEWLNRSRLRVDTRKWAASKIAPRNWGDKLALQGTLDGQLRIVDDTGT